MRVFVLTSAVCASLAVCTVAHAQDSTAAERPWYDRLSIRGYAQFRYNRLLETNEHLKCSTCDRSIGDNGGFFLRRARLVVSGRVNDRISISIQPDFTTDLGGRENTLVLRHYYADIYLDAAKSFRARIGQSEVTTGFEAVQSSSRRGPFDRADAMESAAPGEQDLGIFLMWAPPTLKKRLRDLQTNALKGTGDYGVITVGAYNGQGGNRAEANDAPHVVARIAYPFLIGKQNVEVDAYGYKGTYTIANGQRAAGVGGANDFDDHRVGGAFILYPQPFGIQAEWSVGRGPRYEAATNAIVDSPVRGGYAMLSYSLAGPGRQRFIAFGRAQYFTGAFKTDPDARSSVVHEYEPGIEWTIDEGLELTAAYTTAVRNYSDSAAPENFQRGRFLRLQAQVSF